MIYVATVVEAAPSRHVRLTWIKTRVDVDVFAGSGLEYVTSAADASIAIHCVWIPLMNMCCCLRLVKEFFKHTRNN